MIKPTKKVSPWQPVYGCTSPPQTAKTLRFTLIRPKSGKFHQCLTHWGRVTHICVNKLTIIGSDDGLLPSRRQAIIQTNGRILLIRNLGTNFSEILSKIYAFSFKKIPLKTSSGKWRPFCLGLNVLIFQCVNITWTPLLLFTRSSNRVSIIKYKQYICLSCRKDIYWLPIMYLTSFFNVVSPTTHSTTFTCQETVKIPFDLRGMPSPSCNINVGDFTMLKNVSCDDANFAITVALEAAFVKSYSPPLADYSILAGVQYILYIKFCLNIGH